MTKAVRLGTLVSQSIALSNAYLSFQKNDKPCLQIIRKKTKYSPVDAPLDPIVGHEEPDLTAQPKRVVRPHGVVLH